MQLLPEDGRYLDRALELAEDAAAFASPNPTVGCVLTSGPQSASPTRVLGEGAHFYERRDHAEIAALHAAAAAGHDVHGATAYVTLEPCSHHGRTGPCADALIAAGIARCVVATVDPNPLVRGQGIAKLRAARIAVDLLEVSDPRTQRARRLNDAFAFSIQHGRPFVTLKSAVSRDGKVAPSPAKRRAHEPFWLTGPAAREEVQRLRHQADAQMTGLGTVLADDPSLTDRTGLPRRQPLVRVVLDTNLRLPLTSRLVATAREDLLVLAAREAPKAREDALRAQRAEVIRLPTVEGRLDLGYVLATLAPFRNLLVEAGTTLNSALLRQGVVDKVVLYTAPAELGPDALPFAQSISPADLQASLTSVHQQTYPNGDAHDLCVTGYLHDPWFSID